MGKEKKVPVHQLTVLLEALEEDRTILTGEYCRKQPERSEYYAKWDQLTTKLNSVEDGVVRSAPKWRQAWRDWKANTKRKAARLATTSDGDDPLQQLTPLEKRVLAISQGAPNVHAGGIDISSISEVDPLDSSSSGSCEEDSTSFLENPEPSHIVTMYAADNTAGPRRLKRSQSEEMDSVTIKKRRIQMVSTETISRQQKEILTRLEVLEKSQQDFQKQQTELLSAILSSLERQLAMESRLGDAVNRIADFIENRVGPGG